MKSFCILDENEEIGRYRVIGPFESRKEATDSAWKIARRIAKRSQGYVEENSEKDIEVFDSTGACTHSFTIMDMKSQKTYGN